MRTNSIAFRLCLMFAVNPDEWLTSRDICTKFDTEPVCLPKALGAALREGWLQRELPKHSPGGMYHYSAGPTLLQHIGRP